MAAAIGNLLRLTDEQVYLGETVLNVYLYRVTSITGLAGNYLELINEWWEDNVLEPITNIQVPSLVHNSRRWENLTNYTDLFTESTPIAGTVSTGGGVLLPSYVTLGFLLERESLTTRNGAKRFSGVPVTWVDGNERVGGDTPVTAVEEALAADVVLGAITCAEPIIWGSPRENPPVVSYDYASIGGARFTRVGTQNTRKQGVGV